MLKLSGLSTLYFSSSSSSLVINPMLMATFLNEFSPADRAPIGITIKVKTVDIRTPNSNDIAIPWNIGSDRMTLEPATKASAVIKIGRVLELHERTTASKNGIPFAYSCTVKSTNKIEFLTIIPAKAIQPIIEVAVNSAFKSQ